VCVIERERDRRINGKRKIDRGERRKRRREKKRERGRGGEKDNEIENEEREIVEERGERVRDGRKERGER